MMSHPLQKHAAISSKIPLVVLACLTLGISLAAASSKLESNSPFLPAGYNTPKPVKPPPVVNGPLSRELEFRGIVQMNGIYEFSLFNKKLNRGYWIAENGSESGISVRNFDLSGMWITVTQNGRSEQLTLMTATDSPLPVAIAVPPTSTNSTPTRASSRSKFSKFGPNSEKNATIPRRRVILPKKQ